MKDGSRVTLKDIARQVNLSIGTVDRAIHNRGRISQETRETVLEKLRELGYTPNTLARALGRSKAMRIVFLSPDCNGFWQEMIRGAGDAAASLADYNLKFEHISVGSEDNVLGGADLIRKAADDRPDGLLAVPLNAYLAQAHIDRAVENGVCVATVNRDSPDSRRLFYYGENPYGVGMAIGAMQAKLLQAGGSAAFLKQDPGNPNFEQRVRGWRDSIAKYAPRAAVAGPYPYAKGEAVAYEIARRLLAQGGDLQAIFADTSTGAAAAAQAVFDAGRAGTVSVVGIDVNERTLALLDGGAMLAVIEQSPYTQGWEAVRLMHRVLMEGYEPEASRFYTKLEVYVDSRHYFANHPETRER